MIKPPAWRSASCLKASLLFSLVNISPQAETSTVQAPFKSAACVEADCVTRSTNSTNGLKMLMKLSDQMVNRLPEPVRSDVRHRIEDPQFIVLQWQVPVSGFATSVDSVPGDR